MTEYRVVILGPRNSGKTVYLGSLFKKLSTAGDLGYFISTPHTETILLNKIFSRVETGWPDPTALANVENWPFDITVRTDDGELHTAARVVYYDYAGGRLTEPQSNDIAKATEKIFDNANIYIGLLDGEILYKEIYLKQRDSVFWDEHVKILCDRMMRAKGKSIHFIVSKWDLFKDSDSSVRDIANLLLEDESFRNLVRSRSTARPPGLTRLIPVSSVGPGFVDMQADGTMVRRKGARPNPLYVETPFACVLPDLIEAELKQKQHEVLEQAEQKERPVPIHLTFFERLSLHFAPYIGRLGLEPSVAEWLENKATRSATTKLANAAEQERQNRLEAQRLRANVKDIETATIFMLNSMTNTVMNLERAYPSSRLV